MGQEACSGHLNLRQPSRKMVQGPPADVVELAVELLDVVELAVELLDVVELAVELLELEVVVVSLVVTAFIIKRLF